MKVKFNMYEIPVPGEQGETTMPQARQQSNGTIKMDTICNELRDLGVNSAQIKAVLDAVSKLMKKSLLLGYHFELDGIGTFSLSLQSNLVTGEKGEKVRVRVDGVNFRCNKELKKSVRKADVERASSLNPNLPSVNKRKKKMFEYIEKAGLITGSKYARINNCSRYQATKDLKSFEEEGLLAIIGKGTHKVYVRKTD